MLFIKNRVLVRACRRRRSGEARTQVWRYGKDTVYSDENAVGGDVEALDHLCTSVSESVHADVDFAVPGDETEALWLAAEGATGCGHPRRAGRGAGEWAVGVVCVGNGGS